MKNVQYSVFLRFFGIVLFIYVLSKIDIAQALSAFKGISITYFLLGTGFAIFTFLIRTLKWQLLTAAVGAKVSFPNLIKIMVKGVFLGIITPAKLGEFWRAKYLIETSPVSGGKAFYTALLDRLVDLLVVGLIVIPGLIVFSSRFGGLGSAWEIIALVFVLFIIFVFFLLKKIGLQKILKFFIKFLLPAAWQDKTDIFLNEFDEGLNSLSLSLFFKLLGYSIFYYFLSVVFYYFTALALGISIPFWYLFFIIAMVWLILTVPITVWGLGTREASLIYFFSFFNISASLTVSFSLLSIFYDILLFVPPGAVLFLKEK